MEPKRPGRPAHQPTEVTRKLVDTLVREGRSVLDIAKEVGVSAPTLRAHYAEELKAPRPQIAFPFGESQEGKRRRPGSRAGRPEHVPDDETRERVEILVAGGMKVWQIAAAIGISEPVLRDRYAAELDAGRSKKRAEILEAMFRAGLGGNVSAQRAYLAQDADLDEPPPPPVSEEPLGKKAAAQAAAITAHYGTDWENLLPN